MPKKIHGKEIEEEHWEKAKKLASEEGRKEDYAYIMGIVKRMEGIKKSSTDELLRSLAYENKFTVWSPSVVDIGEDLNKGLSGGIIVRESYSRPESLSSYVTSKPIGGYTSTEELDRQQEQLLAKGLNFKECVTDGWFNDNHMQDTASVVGVPSEIELHEHPELGLRWYAKGFLLDGYARSESIWNLAKCLQKLGRKLGYSVEGSIIDRQGPVILKALIRNIAITPNMVNTSCTWNVLTKAMSGHEDYYKALMVDTPINPISGGGVLAGQSLEGRMRSAYFVCNECGEAFANSNEIDRHRQLTSHIGVVRKSGSLLNEQEAIKWVLDRHPRYNEGLARNIVQYAIKTNMEVSRNA